MVHRKGRSRDYRSLQVREPYVEPETGDAFEDGLRKLGWTIGPPDRPLAPQETDMPKTTKPFEDVRVPPSFRGEDEEPRRRLEAASDDEDEVDEEDEFDEEDDRHDGDRDAADGQDSDEDLDDQDEPDPQDEPEEIDEDEADEPEPEPEPRKAPKKETKKPPVKKAPDKKPAAAEKPEVPTAPARPNTPDQGLVDAVLQAVDERLTERVAEVVSGVVSAKLEDVLPKRSRAKDRLQDEPPPTILPITSDHIYALSRRPPTSLVGTRDLAMVMLGLSAALRRSEILSLRLNHLIFHEDGMIVVLPRTRDMIYVPMVVDRICTVRAVANWFQDAELKPSSGYLFRRIKDGRVDVNLERRLPKKELTKAVRRVARRAGLNPDNYNWRSLRAGFLLAYESSRTVDQKIDALRRG